MRKKFFPLSVFGLIFCLSFMGAAHAADAPIAEILTVIPGASVSRDGQTLPLERFSALHLSDTVTTDATGRVRILFADDSTVDLGANTSLDIRDFADSGAKSVFNVHLLQGVARVVTGKIVEANPQGFAVITPEATIGIRGTILSVRTGNGKTTTFVENTTRAVYVNDINVPGGNKITFPGDSRPVPIQPEDRRSLSRDLAFRGGAGAAAAAPEPGTAATNGFSASPGLLAALPGVEETELASLPVNEIASPEIASPLLTPTKGTATGTLTTTLLTGASSWSGSFSFDMDLGSGTVGNASMQLSGVLGQDPDGGGLTPLPTSFDLHGGSGVVSGNNFSIGGFTGDSNWRGTTVSDTSYDANISSDQYMGPYAAMKGTVSPSGSDVSVSGDYKINAPGSNSGARSGDEGTFSGKLQ
jgi:hypothetical protein